MNITHQVVRQNGELLDGREREEVIFAVDHDKTSLTIDGHDIEIVQHQVDADGNKITKIKVDGIYD